MSYLKRGKVYHKRYSPKVNEFTYPCFYLSFPINEVSKLKRKFFSINRWNLFSFNSCDHGFKDHRPLEQWGRDILQKSGIDFKGEFILQTLPRMCGYVFNPVSFWYCIEDNRTIAIIAEVNNTFGENHNYVIDMTKNINNKIVKKFHVSPFYDVEGFYKFTFKDDFVGIDYFVNDKLQLKTLIEGKSIELSDKNLLQLFILFPLFTRFVVVLIHYQALKLLFKKARFYKKPEPPIHEVSYDIPS